MIQRSDKLNNMGWNGLIRIEEAQKRGIRNCNDVSYNINYYNNDGEFLIGNIAIDYFEYDFNKDVLFINYSETKLKIYEKENWLIEARSSTLLFGCDLVFCDNHVKINEHTYKLENFIDMHKIMKENHIAAITFVNDVILYDFNLKKIISEHFKYNGKL
jgi:hypothetical protein